MKTREELASEYGLKFFKKSFQRLAVDDIFISDVYKDGFDAGFARAVEMLRSDDAVAARYAANFKVLTGDTMSPPAKFFADWLEKQSP